MKRKSHMSGSLRVGYLFSLSTEEVEAVKAAFDVLPERPTYKERPESGPIAVVTEVQELRDKYEAFQVNHYFTHGYDPSTEQLVPDEWQKLVLKDVKQENADS